MVVKSTKQIASMLGIHQGRIEQWISRSQFLPRVFAEKGLGRDWSYDEALRLFIFVRLVDVVRMDPRTAGVMTMGGINPAAVSDNYFVGYSGRPEYQLGWQAAVIPKARVGEFLRDCCTYPAVMAAGSDAGTLAHNSEKAWRGPAVAAVLLDLDDILHDLTEVWGN